MHELRISFTGEISQVASTTKQIIDYCKLVGFDKESRFRIQVVLAEAINNVIAYATPTKPVLVSCLFDESQQEIVINMIDNGSVIENLPLMDFPEGKAESGRGWPIIFNWMDNVSHVRQGDENHLTLKKTLG